MKGYTKGKKFIPTGNNLVLVHKPSRVTKEMIQKKHAPNGTFTHINPRTRQKESIKLSKIHALDSDKNQHALVGKGSDGRPVTKIV
jgi:hypothetical protein